MNKSEYYTTHEINKINADYNLIYGQRANGKSYAVKQLILNEIYVNCTKMVYLRRWDTEIKTNDVQSYFADMNITDITNGEYDGVIVYQGRIYWANYDDSTQKMIKRELIGYSLALSNAVHYKSNVYENVKNVVFEEFIPDGMYLPNEPDKLQNLISTIARHEKCRVWLIGNTITRISPYFVEWELTRVLTQQRGTIDIYYIKNDDNVIKIACEYAENSEKKSKMFFGKSAKMINNGEWVTENQPHLNGKIERDYNKIHEIIIECDNLKFYCQFLISKIDNNMCWYVQPKYDDIYGTIHVITDRPVMNMWYTYGLIALSENEQKLFKFFDYNKICFSDNLTGTEFKKCYKKIRAL